MLYVCRPYTVPQNEVLHINKYLLFRMATAGCLSHTQKQAYYTKNLLREETFF